MKLKAGVALLVVLCLMSSCVGWVPEVPPEMIAEKYPNWGYWTCDENHEWIKYRSPSYDKPSLSCGEIRLAKQMMIEMGGVVVGKRNMSMTVGEQKRQAIANCAKFGATLEGCECRRYFRDAGAQCSDDNECEGYCLPTKYVDIYVLGWRLSTVSRGSCQASRINFSWGCEQRSEKGFAIFHVCRDGGGSSCDWLNEESSQVEVSAQ